MPGFYPMLNSLNYRRYAIVAFQILVTLGTIIFPGHVSDRFPFQNLLEWSKVTLCQMARVYAKVYNQP